jgi:hypothetical protein
MKKIYFALFLTLFAYTSAYSQKVDYKELFLAAESYYLFEEFNEALPLYMRIHRQFPENDNINFKIGVCYLNDPYQKDKSISYLEEAVQNINPKYRENNFKEEAAPLEALFHLANAYRVNNQLEKAKEYYQLFLERMDPEIYDAQLVQDQIDACNAAKNLMSKPIDYDVENLSERINTRFSEVNAVVSGDETRMAFISKLQFYDAVFYTEKINGEWTAPRNILPELQVDGDVYPTSMSYDGTEMYIYRNDDFIGNIYLSKLVEGKWTPLEKLNDNINTRFWESHASVSKDGSTLYFSSNRKGGYGGLDIYRSEKQANGDWGPAINLGPVINTPYNDDTPFITADQNKIYFSSYGHYNMGGYDLFVSEKNSEDKWGEPLNLGHPINTTDDNQFLVPVGNGQVAYYSRYDAKDGFGRNDIYRYKIYSDDYPRMYAIEGLIDYQGEIANPEDVEINVINKSTSDTLASVNPNADGEFNFEVPKGKYDVVFDSEKFRKKILGLEVGPDTPHSGLKLSAPVVLALIPTIIPVNDPEKAQEELLSILEDSIIYASPGDVIDIRFNATEGASVKAEAINKSDLIKSETITGTKDLEIFSFEVEPGENLVTFEATDPDGNEMMKSLKVIVPEIAEVDISDTFVPRTEEVISESGTIESESEADQLLDMLKATTGAVALKALLDNLDPSKENINTRDQLISHLYESAADNNFTAADVDKLLINSGILTEIDLLKRDLGSVASPELSSYLMDLDTEANTIRTEKDLYDFLLDNTEAGNYSKKDVYEAISKFRFADVDIQRVIDELIALSEGNLKKALEELDPQKADVNTLIDLLNYLLDNTENYGYTEEQVYDLFYRYLVSGEKKAKTDEKSELKDRFNKGTKLTVGILLLEGFIILILIILARRRKKEKAEGSELS